MFSILQMQTAVGAHAGAGSEIKQHGGCFFAHGIIKAQHFLSGSVSARSQSQSLTPECTEDASPSVPSICDSPRHHPADRRPCGRVDAADTEHVLLENSMMWDPARRSSSDSMRAACEENLVSTSVEHADDTAVRSPVSSVVQTFARVQLESVGGVSSLMSRPARCNSAAALKRSRSGLSNRLPSLVELPMEEDAGISHSSRTSSIGSPNADMQGTKSVSLPGIWGRCSLTQEISAGGCDAGSNFSLSSPGAVHGNLAGHQARGDAHDATSSTAITDALARASHSAPMLSLVRAALCKAAFGQGLKHLSAADGFSQSPSLVSSTNSAELGSESNALGRMERSDQKRHGSQVLMQVLEAADADSRRQWLQLVSQRGLLHGCGGLSKHLSSALFNSLRW
jgi:hypothetical protein